MYDFALGSDSSFETLVEFRVLLSAKKQVRKRFGVAHGEVARVVGTQQTDRARDVRRYDGYAAGERFAHNVCSPLHQRCQNEKSRAGEQADGLPLRLFTYPRVSGVVPSFAFRSTFFPRSQRASDVKQMEVGGLGKQTNRLGCAEGVLDVTHVADDADFPTSSPRRERPRWSREGLVNDADLRLEAPWQFLCGFGLERDESISQFE